MQLTFLGTGSAIPTGDRHQTGILIDTNETTVLLDCGSGVIHRLARTEPGYEGIETVLLTHHHLDHITDLLPLIKARWLTGAETLTIIGPPGTQDLLEGLLELHEYMQGRVDLTITDITPDTASVPGVSVSAMETRHSMYCLAYRFKSPAGDFVFSGDSEAFDNLITFAEGARILAHDCSFPDSVDVSNHPTPTSLGKTLSGADIDTVYLTHLYPHTNGHHDEMLATIRNHYDGDVRFARDGLQITID